MTDITNAAIDLEQKKSKIVKVFASTGIERKDTVYKAGAFKNFDTTNKFNLYRQLSLIASVETFSKGISEENHRWREVSEH